MKRRIGILLLAVLGVCIALLVGCLVYSLRIPPAAPLPNPNGFDDFLKAG